MEKSAAFEAGLVSALEKTAFLPALAMAGSRALPSLASRLPAPVASAARKAMPLAGTAMTVGLPAASFGGDVARGARGQIG